MIIIKYHYTHSRGWDCVRVVNPDEAKKWIDIETHCGNCVRQVSPCEYIVTIGY